MRALRFTHVSISARDLAESVRFYAQVFGMERIPTYTFAFPVHYLRLGEQQLHLFQRDTEAPISHHIGLDWPDLGTLDRSRLPELKRLEDGVEHTEDGRRSTLYHTRPKRVRDW
jgi:catechol 2,3-dioxygenase-like lactoylglutathione lyase family enzyme